MLSLEGPETRDGYEFSGKHSDESNQNDESHTKEKGSIIRPNQIIDVLYIQLINVKQLDNVMYCPILYALMIQCSISYKNQTIRVEYFTTDESVISLLLHLETGT